MLKVSDSFANSSLRVLVSIQVFVDGSWSDPCWWITEIIINFSSQGCLHSFSVQLVTLTAPSKSPPCKVRGGLWCQSQMSISGSYWQDDKVVIVTKGKGHLTICPGGSWFTPRPHRTHDNWDNNTYFQSKVHPQQAVSVFSLRYAYEYFHQTLSWVSAEILDWRGGETDKSLLIF